MEYFPCAVLHVERIFCIELRCNDATWKYSEIREGLGIEKRDAANGCIFRASCVDFDWRVFCGIVGLKAGVGRVTVRPVPFTHVLLRTT